MAESKTFIENINTLANATSLATGDVVEDTRIARDEAEAAASAAEVSETNAAASAVEADDWANKGHNNPVKGTVGIDAEYSSYHWSVEASLYAGDPVINDAVISASYTWSSEKINTLLATKADTTHTHAGTYEPAFSKNTAFNKNFGSTADDVSRGYHVHDGTNGSVNYEPNIGAKGTAFNKNFGTTAGTVSEGTHTHDYEPSFTKNTAFNKNFVADTGNPLADEIPRGNHTHTAAGVSYDNTGNDLITSTTVQGALQNVDSFLGTIETTEKTYGTIALDGATRTVTITTAGTPVKMDVLTKSAGAFNNMTTPSSCNLTINYATAPDNLIEGRFSANVTCEFPASATEITLTAYKNGAAINADWFTDVNATTKDGTTTGTLALDGYITGLENGDYIELYITNESNTNNIVIRSLTMVFDGSPQGALIATGLSVAHSDTTGRDVADSHPQSAITGLTAALAAKSDTSHTHVVADITDFDISGKADKAVPLATGNIATLDGTGNLVDGGQTLAQKADVGGNAGQLFKVADGVSNDDAASFGQMNTMAASYVTITTFNTHEGAANPHGTTHTDVGAAAAVHTHAISDTTGLQTALDGKYDEVGSAVTDNIPTFAAGNTLADSGVSLSELMEQDTTTFTGDANTLTTAGSFTVGNTATNIPTAHAYAIVVFGNGSTTTTQIAVRQGTGETYVRTYQTVWSSWNEIADTTEVATKVTASAPSISGTLDCNNNNVEEVKTVLFNGLYNNGTKNSAWTLAPNNGQYQMVTMTGSCTMSITTPTSPTTIYLHVHQDATGGHALTLPSGLTVGGAAKSNTTTASARDLLMIHYDGTNYVFEYMLDLS